MPQKTLTRRVETTEVQGEGAYVVVRVPTWGEQKAFRRRAEENEAQGKKVDEALVEETLIERVIAWNWSDENDVPLPLPKDDPSVLDRLTDEELTAITRAIFGTTGSDAKN